jgi:hypothetical protein
VLEVIGDKIDNYQKRLLIRKTFRIKRKRINYLCNISGKNRYLYMETPKVGCSTIKKNLQLLENDGEETGEKNIHDKDASPLLSPLDKGVDLKEALNDYFKFTFVRNPYTRILSCYLDKFRPDKPKFRQHLGLPDNAEVSFEEFLQRVKLQDPKEMNIHWMPQSTILAPESVDYNFVGRFENFQEEFKQVLTKISVLNGLPAPEEGWFKSRHSKFRSDAGTQLEQFMTRPAQKLIQKIYSEDFERYGYSLKIESLQEGG